MNFWQIFVSQKDPAIEKFGWIRENTDIFFKFKPRSVRNAVMCCLLVPAAVLYICKTQVTDLAQCFSYWAYVCFINSIAHDMIAENWPPHNSDNWSLVQGFEWLHYMYIHTLKIKQERKD